MRFLDLDAVKKMVRKIKDADHAFECAEVIDSLKRAVAEADEKWQKAMLRYIRKHGDIEMKMGTDTIRYYAGHKKETKCTDPNVAFRLLNKRGGRKAVREALNSQPFKPGHCKAVLTPKAWDKCFHVIEKKKLDVDGKPKKILKRADSRYN